MQHDEILTLPELAGLLKVAEKTVYSLAQKRELPGFKVGGQWRFSRPAINEWIESQTRQDAQSAPSREEEAVPAPRSRPSKVGN